MVERFWISFIHLKKRPLFSMKLSVQKIEFIHILFLDASRFGRVRTVSSQKLSKCTVFDNVFGCGNERPHTLHGICDTTFRSKRVASMMSRDW